MSRSLTCLQPETQQSEVFVVKVMVTETYPMSSMYKVVETFLDTMVSEPLPDFITTDGIYVRWGGRGLKAYAVYDVAQDRAEEGFKALTSFFVNFGEIDGFKLKSEVVMTVEDALSVLGKKMP
jgi:hypothetical protein